MTFFYDLNRQLAAVEQQHATPLSEGKNHLGDAEQMTYSGWKAACRKAHPDVWFDGDRDIASAMVGPKPYKRGKTKEVGQWDGDKGSVYKSTAKSSTVAESLNMVSEEYGYDSMSPEHAAKIVAYMDQDVPMSTIMDEYPELSRMIDNIAGEHRLHGDDDFEEIEDILYDSLSRIADRMLESDTDDFGDRYDASGEETDTAKTRFVPGRAYGGANQAMDDEDDDTLMNEREIANDRDITPKEAAEIVALMDTGTDIDSILKQYPELAPELERRMEYVFNEPGQVADDMNEIQRVLRDELAHIAAEESAAPMNEREIANDRDRKFAALAKPYDEITYADKITGARKGVSEGSEENVMAQELDDLLRKGVDYPQAVKTIARKYNTHTEYVVQAYEGWGNFEHDDTFDIKEQGVAEGLGKSIKRGVKNIKRGLLGWDKTAVGPGGEKLGDPKDIVRRNKNYDDETLKMMQDRAGSPWSGSPADLQKRVIDRELKKRGNQDVSEGRIDDLRDRQEADRRERGEEKATSKTKFVAGRAYGGARQEVDDEDDEDAPRTKAKPAAGDAPRKRGRPVGSKRAIGAKGPGFKSKLLKKGAIAEYSEVDEGAIDDLRDRLEAERRERGEEKAASKTKFVAGRAYGGARQEVDDEDDEDAPRTKAKPATDAPRKRGRPVGSKRAIGAKGPGFKSKLLKKGAIAETDIDTQDPSEYDQEGDMAHDQLSTAKDAADELRSILTADENLPEWVQKKITMAVDYLDTARDYMKSQKDDAEPVAEKAVSKAQRTAAGIAHAAKKGNVPKSQLKGASREMAKMPAGELKKFAKTKEKGLPAKKTKEVEETTTAGSVATGGDAPKSKGKGGMQFGKGIYDSLDRQLEQMIAEGMHVTATVSNQGDTPTKTVSVTADGDDADRLMELLSLSGINGMSADSDHSCPTCSQSPCGCAELVDENSPDWPTNTEVSNDALQYSGGLNRPKSTGQATGAIPDLSRDRQGQAYKSMVEGDSMTHRLYTELGKL